MLKSHKIPTIKESYDIYQGILRDRKILETKWANSGDPNLLFQLYELEAQEATLEAYFAYLN